MFQLPSIYFERLLENSLDIVIAVDHRGQIIFYNDGASKTLGYTREEVRGKRGIIYPSIEEARRMMKAMRSEEVGGMLLAHLVCHVEQQFDMRVHEFLVLEPITSPQTT